MLGRDIDAALSLANAHDVLCFDMLGEGARTATDAERYFQSYEAAIHRVGKACTGKSVRETTTLGQAIRFTPTIYREPES